MKPNVTPRIPAERDLNAGTGLALLVIGLVITLLGLAADGRVSGLPAVLGGTFGVAGAVILGLNWRSRSRRR